MAQKLVLSATCHPSATTLNLLYIKTFPWLGGRWQIKTRKTFSRVSPHDYHSLMIVYYLATFILIVPFASLIILERFRNKDLQFVFFN